MRVTRKRWITSSLALLVICAGFYAVNRYVIVHGGGPLQNLYSSDTSADCHAGLHDYYASTWATVSSGKSVHIQNVSIGGAKGAALTASYVLPASLFDQHNNIEVSPVGTVPLASSGGQSAGLWARHIEARGARLSGPDHHNGWVIVVLVHVSGATGSLDRINVRYDSRGYQYNATGSMTYQFGTPC